MLAGTHRYGQETIGLAPRRSVVAREAGKAVL